MPEKIDLRRGRHGDLLYDVVFQQVVVHTKGGGLGIQIFFLQVVTIVAIQVTDRSGRLGKDLKFP